MTSTTCFSRDELKNYLLGDLPEAASGAVALHVETCVECEATVTELDRESDTLITSLREPVAQVRVLKAGQPYRQLTVKQTAHSLRLGAGEYEIEIVSNADGLEIENGSFTLKRGETWLARIVHREGAADHGHPAVDEPTYEGKTLAEWLALLHRERSTKQLYEACQALDKLAIGDDTAKAVEA